MARMLADSQELFIAISDGYSFPEMHCVTSKDGAKADEEIVINISINSFFFPLLLRFFLFSQKTAPFPF